MSSHTLRTLQHLDCNVLTYKILYSCRHCKHHFTRIRLIDLAAYAAAVWNDFVVGLKIWTVGTSLQNCLIHCLTETVVETVLTVFMCTVQQCPDLNWRHLNKLMHLLSRSTHVTLLKNFTISQWIYVCNYLEDHKHATFLCKPVKRNKLFFFCSITYWK